METIKEEKKADLKQLLNSLIKRGRVPFGDKRITNVSWKLEYTYVGTYNWLFWSNHNLVEMRKSTREVCSKSSGLWQFVCENGMVNDKDLHERIKDIYEYDDGLAWKGIDYKKGCNSLNYEYRLIESSLRDESELEDFLLSNIKVEGEND